MRSPALRLSAVQLLCSLAALVVLACAASAGPALAHDVHLVSIHATIPTATWDAKAHSWTLGLAGMIECDANSERADGVAEVEPLGGGGPLAVVLVSGKPDAVARETHGGLTPGMYHLLWGAAACSAQPQNENDNGQHGDYLENIEIRDVKLPDCDDPKAVYAMHTRPLIPIAGGMPPDAKIACPVPQTPDCDKSRAVMAGVHRAPLIAVQGTGVTVEPCTPKGPDNPAAKVRCRRGPARFAVAAIHHSPLLPPGPPSSNPPKSTKSKCYLDMEALSALPTPRPCARAVRPAPLIAVPCTPPKQGPPMGYASGIQELKHVRVQVSVGRTETVVLKLSRANRRIAMRKGAALRLRITVRDARGAVHRTTSSQFTLE